MPKCIAAVFAAAWNLIRALISGLFSQPRGRHSAEQLRRRRSTRVRPYAPMTPAAPERLPSHPTVHDSPEETPTLKPSTAEFDADEIALVRPYFTAHEAKAVAEAKAETEADAARAQDRATARLRAWGANLDHLEFGPDTNFSFGPPPEGTRTYTLDQYPAPDTDPEPEPEPSAPAPTPTPTDTFHVPAPRTPSPRVPARMNGLPHLSRIRARQQQRRSSSVSQGQTRVLQGAGA
ncbi:hypothetical protein IDM40_24235 [Nocardiopsis sp. HNM0947]|uniref:Uncharacterized protein n=1 Tax=Nocardiopsis coralli TaxID=2772213 RepID=A0ABR9PD51_9ACTN|nr:hypothetical protein [Nocardiopsis coralli]MBE3001782.1 hypothetical protein [Nocardiopsis coralli]